MQPRFFIPLIALAPYWIWLHAPDGAPHLNPGNPLPLVYALVSLTGYLALGWWLFSFDADDRLRSLGRLGIGSVTSMIAFGIVSVVRGQLPQPASGMGLLHGADGLGLQVLELLRSVPGVPLWATIIAYTVQVGIVEETVKAVTARTDALDGTRVRAGFGFIAGVGFGVAEGVLYSFRDYQGASDWHAYAIRFVSLVGLHACMSTIAVLCLPEDWWDPRRYWIMLLRLVPIALLHGAYDALLVHHRDVWAGIVATVICLLVPSMLWLLEDREGEP